MCLKGCLKIRHPKHLLDELWVPLFAGLAGMALYRKCYKCRSITNVAQYRECKA